MSTGTRPSSEQIAAAHRRIMLHIVNTPVLTSAMLDRLAGCSIFFKCENLQQIGAFKARGATNAVLSLTESQLRYGVATHSSGNHAQAVARAAHIAGVKAYVVMPGTSPLIKKRGVEFYGGHIIECESSLASREETLARVVHDTGAHVVHPYNDFSVIAGQATAAWELIEEVNDLDYLFAPVGGGGLLSGTLLAAQYYSPATRVIGGEPHGADDAYRSLRSGKVEASQAASIADGLLSSLGDKTFPIIQEFVTDIVTVTDLEIIAAMKLIWEELRVIAEPSGAVPLAALLKEKEKLSGKKAGIIISGGNVDLDRAFSLFSQV
ncbi:MAG TPA: pyridoxal-phosphate dependent enzyme [Cyclobacteriaceae bacterium]|nr:pyridoxal-phosphate dependent enzyme [Cyclobacteriaceae bacterium]